MKIQSKWVEISKVFQCKHLSDPETLKDWQKQWIQCKCLKRKDLQGKNQRKEIVIRNSAEVPFLAEKKITWITKINYQCCDWILCCCDQL